MFVLRSTLLALAVIATALAQTNVNLGTASDFVILSKTGISTVPASVVTGNIGVSPIAGAAITGFTLSPQTPTSQYTVSAQINGQVFAADYATPTPTKMTAAISDMEIAYTDAAGRTTTCKDSAGAPLVCSDALAMPNLNFMAGLVTGQTFKAGVHTWGSSIVFDTITIEGTATDIFIFQTTGNVVASSGANVVLAGGAKASNIVWQVAGLVDAGANSHLEGIFIVKTSVALKTLSSLNGRILSQTAVTLDQSTITEPAN